MEGHAVARDGNRPEFDRFDHGQHGLDDIDDVDHFRHHGGPVSAQAVAADDTTDHDARADAAERRSGYCTAVSGHGADHGPADLRSDHCAGGDRATAAPGRHLWPR